MEYLKLGIASLLPIILAVGIYFLDKYTKFHKLNFWIRQAIFGVAFGALAILGTHWGIEIHGAKVNARDAAVIIGGLFCGWPTGIIAGLIGGLERFFGVYWFNLPTFTQLACSISTIIAGFAAAGLRHFMFENKRPGATAGFLLALVIEIFHLFMVFVLRSQEYQKAFQVVNACTLPMLIANSLSVLLCGIIFNILEKGFKKAFAWPKSKTLRSKIQKWLGGLIVGAFLLSSMFIFLFQNEIGKAQVNTNIKNSISEVISDVKDKSDYNLLSITQKVCEEVNNLYDVDKYPVGQPGDTPFDQLLRVLASSHKVKEISFINEYEVSGVKKFEIRNSNELSFKGFNMHSGSQSEEFYQIITGDKHEIVQQYGPISRDSKVYRKYAAKYIVLNPGAENVISGMIQVGYDTEEFQEDIVVQINNITANRRLYDTGSITIFDSNQVIVSKGSNMIEDDIYNEILPLVEKNPKQTKFVASIKGTDNYFYYDVSEGYTLMCNIPVYEADLSRNIAIYVNTFLEIIIFGLIFIMMFFLVEKIANRRIKIINDGLKEITAGNLNTVVDGGSTTEFKELSTGINGTVDALKGYIKEAETRIDKELAFAKSIQASCLPSRFPAFPKRKEFDIYAFMKPAKEVGGDFYDFYFTHHNTINFMIADVSGKGIPAALFMMRAKAEIKSLCESGIELNEVFHKANNILLDGNDTGMFVTSWQASMDLETGVLKFVNAGHNPPLVKHADGKFEYLRSKPNMVLSTFEDLNFNLNEYQLSEGDIVFLYTDGVNESVNNLNEQYGEARLQNILNAKEFIDCKDLCETVMDDVTKFVDGAAQFDDITMVAFKYIKKAK